MSVQAAVNGAQREVGLYVGVDGVVRKLFSESGISNTSAVNGIDVGMEPNVPFNISDYALVIASAADPYENVTLVRHLVILPFQKVSISIEIGRNRPSFYGLRTKCSFGVNQITPIERDSPTVIYDPTANTLQASEIKKQGYSVIKLYK